MKPRFAALGEKGRKLYLYEEDRQTKVRQVLWGDFLKVESEAPDGWLKIDWAPRSDNPRKLFIPKSDTVSTRPMEIIFVDVGQGDGAVLITPETGDRERIVVIDAGEGDNMERFLHGRFRAFRGFDFDSAILTHPDSDHYRGFEAIFKHPNIGFRHIYHSGLVERPVSGTFEKLGGLVEDAATGRKYVTELAQDTADIEAHFSDAASFGRKEFPPVMHAALENVKIGKIEMLSTAHGTMENGRSYLPGFSPSSNRDYTVEVLGPVVEHDDEGRPRLRKIGSYGETKNGHSVLLKLCFKDFSVLFGGDLNHKAEKFLLSHYAGLDRFPRKGSAAYDEMIEKAAETFRCDVMKVCHHGSEKVTDAFLATVHPACFVISSGDQEGHVHPRPDLLGRLGRFGRGHAPVLLSTELQRSTREHEDAETVRDLQDDVEGLARETDPKARSDMEGDIRRRIAALAKTNVDVYGAIYLKTDGERLVLAFKIETDSPKKRWFYFEYTLNENHELVRVD